MANRSVPVTIIDYELGNLFNVQHALEKVGARVQVTQDPKTVLNSERIILPGVAAFPAGMSALARLGLVSAIRDFAGTGRPIMGLCLGMQLLMSESEEKGLTAGLDLIKGRVTELKNSVIDGLAYKVPHYGWSTLEPTPKGGAWEGTCLEGLRPGSYSYFVHSFQVIPNDPSVTLAKTQYGENEFCSVIRKDNVEGCQFHPERSGAVGLKILQNFVNGKK